MGARVEAAGEVLSLFALLIAGTNVQIMTQKALQVRAAAAAPRSADLTDNFQSTFGWKIAVKAH